jgi:hypothetical protein
VACGDERALLLGQRGEQVQDERVDVGAKLRDQGKGTLWAMSLEMK